MKNISRLYINPFLLFFNLCCFSSINLLCQNSNSSNYHAQVLSKVLNDTAFLSRFNLIKSPDKPDIIAVVGNEIKSMPNYINGYKVSQEENRKTLCENFFSNARKKVAIVFTPTNIIDSLNCFYISLSCYEVVKSNGNCIWKIFGGSTFSLPTQSEFVFFYNTLQRKWLLKE